MRRHTAIVMANPGGNASTSEAHKVGWLIRWYAALALVLLVCAAASADIWIGPGILQTHAGGDSPFLLQRTYELAVALRSGVFPVRWMPDAAFGLGYPFFNFYAALPYYLAALLNLAGFDLLTAIKLTQTIGMLAAAGAMWVYSRKHLPVSGALFATIAYVLAPYHLVNVYVRGDSLQEFYAFIWYPMILWSVDQVIDGPGTDNVARRLSAISAQWGALLVLVCALAGLVLTHNVSALIFAPFIVLYTLARLLQQVRGRNYRRIMVLSAWLAGAALLAVVISAWFWAPALGESNAVQLSNQTTGYFDFNNHFRSLNLVQPNVVFDYSVDGSLNAFAMALPQAALVILGVLAWLRYDRRRGTMLVAFLLFALSTLLITPLSRPIWNATTVLPLAQFPWRFLSVQAVFAALLIGNIARLPGLSKHAEVSSPPGSRSSRAIAWTAQAAIVSALLLALPGLPNERLDIRSEDITPQTLQLYEWFSGNIGSTIRAEYLPQTVQPRPVVGPDLLQQPRHALSVVGTVASSALTRQTAAGQVWHIAIASDVATFTLPLLYWPGWHAEVSSVASGGMTATPMPIALSPYAGSGWVMLSLPKGDYELTLLLTGTPLERVAESVSLVGLIVLVGAAIVGLWQGRSQMRSYRRPLVAAAAVVVALVLAAQVSRLMYQSVTAPLLSIDYGDRQFVHRSPVTFTAANGDAYVLTGAEITPTQIRAGDIFTLATTWRDDHAPAEVGIDQELPSGGYFAYLFRFAHSLTFGPPGLSHHVAITDALPGPLLLKLVVRDTAGNIYTPTNRSGAPLARLFLAGLTVNAPSESPADQVAAPIRTFPNGIVLRTLDWYQPTDHDLCYRPGWESTRPLAAALQVSFLMRGADGREIARADVQPQAGLEPTWSWPQGALVRDGICVKTTGLLQPGESYTLLVRWYRVLDQLPDGEVTLVGNRAQDTVNAPNLPHPVITEHTYTLPAVQHSTAVTFGDNIELLGYNLVTTAQRLDVTFFWTALTTPALDYKSFVHLSPVTSEEPVRQADRYTLDGEYPTGMWIPGEIVSDTVQLDLAGVAPGRYQLALGWYDPQTLARLPAVTGRTALPDGRYVLVTLDYP